MTKFAAAAGAALHRAVDDLAGAHGIAPDASALERVRALTRSLEQACAYFESRVPLAPVTSTSPPPDSPAPSPVPAGPGLDQYRRIAAAGGDAILVARLLHDVGLIERLKVLRTVFDLSLDEARAVDDLARAAAPPSPRV